MSTKTKPGALAAMTAERDRLAADVETQCQLRYAAADERDALKTNAERLAEALVYVRWNLDRIGAGEHPSDVEIKMLDVVVKTLATHARCLVAKPEVKL